MISGAGPLNGLSRQLISSAVYQLELSKQWNTNTACGLVVYIRTSYRVPKYKVPADDGQIRTRYTTRTWYRLHRYSYFIHYIFIHTVWFKHKTLSSLRCQCPRRFGEVDPEILYTVPCRAFNERFSSFFFARYLGFCTRIFFWKFVLRSEFFDFLRETLHRHALGHLKAAGPEKKKG